MIGSGLIACAAAIRLADRGAQVRLVAGSHAGAASPAAAGLLAPSLERHAPAVAEFALAARARFHDFVTGVAARAGRKIGFEQRGILDIALSDDDVAAMRERLPESAEWLEDSEIRAMEPALAPTRGGVLWAEDATVDNVALLEALVEITRAHPRIARSEDTATAVIADGAGARVRLQSEMNVTADTVVLAAGAWSAQVEGCRHAVVVEPVRGQLVALAGAPVSRPVHCHDSYLVPRRGQTIAGSTMEWVGFVPDPEPATIGQLAAAGARLCPALRDSRVERGWAGLRPVTPDRLPLIGRDPEFPALVYACGHSRNGILMADVTAVSVAEICFEDSLTFDLSQFRPDRFEGTFRGS